LGRGEKKQTQARHGGRKKTRGCGRPVEKKRWEGRQQTELRPNYYPAQKQSVCGTGTKTKAGHRKRPEKKVKKPSRDWQTRQCRDNENDRRKMNVWGGQVGGATTGGKNNQRRKKEPKTCTGIDEYSGGFKKKKNRSLAGKNRGWAGQKTGDSFVNLGGGDWWGKTQKKKGERW